MIYKNKSLSVYPDDTDDRMWIEVTKEDGTEVIVSMTLQELCDFGFSVVEFYRKRKEFQDNRYHKERSN